MNISFHFERSNDGNAEPSFWLIAASPSSSSGRAKKRKDWRVGEERELVKKFLLLLLLERAESRANRIIYGKGGGGYISDATLFWFYSNNSFKVSWTSNKL